MWNLDLAGNVSIDRTQNVNARRKADERFAGIISQLPIKHLSGLEAERTFCYAISMPRPKVHSRISTASAAMGVFWARGYEATSLKHLVQQTGASRQSIYSDFGGKRELFLAALECYQDEVVSPAFSHVERAGANLTAVESYFHYQIERAETVGLPGPGCLIANTITEVAPHDVEIYERVKAHNERLFSGFSKAFKNEIRTENTRRQTAPNTDALATMTVIFTQGLWSTSRVINDAAQLYIAVEHFLKLVKLELSR